MTPDGNKRANSISPAASRLFETTWLRRYLAAALILLVVAVGILAWVPPVSRDALTHHLVVSKMYLQEGKIYEIPEIAFSYYPMNLDLLYLVPLYFGNDILPKYIHFAFALLTAGIIFAYICKRMGSVYGLLGALFFLSIPVIVKLSVPVYVDLGLTFFSFAALLALFRWRETDFRPRWLLLAGAACGLALGTKYNGLVTLFILSLITPVFYIRSHYGEPARRQFKAVGYAVVFAGMALMVFSPWMIRNVMWTGNPIYPLYRGLFNSIHQIVEAPEDEAAGTDEIDTASTKRSAWNHIATRRLIYGESWWQIALLPVRIFFQGADDNPKYFDGKLNPFLFLLPLAAFALGGRCPLEQKLENRILLVFVVLYIAIAFASNAIRIRYIAPVIPPLVVLSVVGFRNLIDATQTFFSHRSARLLGAAVFTLALALNAAYVIHQFQVIAPLDYISGKIDRDDYITRYRPEYAVLQYANKHLEPDAKILALFIGNRRYYSDRPLLIKNHMLRSQVIESRSPRELVEKLRSQGITHMVIGYDLFNRWGLQDLEDHQKLLLNRFFKQETRLLKTEGGYGLYLLNHTSG
jgi:4-amino-4-deoxy-L-arabinose transferase-like glycosyltransferase